MTDEDKRTKKVQDSYRRLASEICALAIKDKKKYEAHIEKARTKGRKEAVRTEIALHQTKRFLKSDWYEDLKTLAFGDFQKMSDRPIYGGKRYSGLNYKNTDEKIKEIKKKYANGINGKIIEEMIKKIEKY